MYGSALGQILRANGHETEFFDPYKGTKSLPGVLAGVEAVILCTPSGAIAELLPQLPHNLPLAVATKGILTPEVFNGFMDLMVLSGPGFAADLEAERPTTLTITDDRLAEWLGRPWLKFITTSDIAGVLMCGALKNVYALEAGRRGLVPESPEWQQYIDSVVAEMRAILGANGATPETAELPCGRADLRLTCGPGSRNYAFGRELARNFNARPVETVEGLSTLGQIRDGVIKVPPEAQILQEILKLGIK